MKDDLVIFNALGRRHLPRLLPVIIAAAALLTVLAVKTDGSILAGSVSVFGSYYRIALSVEVLYAYILLSGPHSGRSKFGYTVGMLRVSERRISAICWAFNTMVFLLIWASLSCSMLIAGRLLAEAGRFDSGPQAFYAVYMLSGNIQQFVPMDYVAGAAALIFYMLSLGILSVPAFSAKEKRHVFAIIMIVYFATAFRSYDLAGNNLVLMGFGIGFFVISLLIGANRFSNLSWGVNVEVDDGE